MHHDQESAMKAILTEIESGKWSPIKSTTTTEKEDMPKKTKSMKVRDQAPKQDPKGGKRGHAVNVGTGKNPNRVGHPHYFN
jgi:hypothetical protein